MWDELLKQVRRVSTQVSDEVEAQLGRRTAGGFAGGFVGKGSLPPDFTASDPERVRAAARSHDTHHRTARAIAERALVGIGDEPATWDELSRLDGQPVTLYLPGRILVAASDLDAAREQLPPEARVCQLRGSEVVRIEWDAAAARDTDPLDLANRLVESGVEAAPDHLITLAPVYMFGPGMDPEPVGTQPDEGYKPSGRVRVTVLDTGLYDASNPPPGGRPGLPVPTWLASRTVAPEHRDVLDVDGDSYLDYAAGHGTFIGDIVASMAPCAELVVERVGTADGVIAESDLADAMDRWLASVSPERAEILNLSLGTYTGSKAPLALGAHLRRLERRVEKDGLDVLVVAAAGNAGVSQAFYPAAFARDNKLVLSVGALDEDDLSKAAEYSNFGDWVQVWAPGTHEGFYPPGAFVYADNLTKAWFKDSGARWAGTSFATPYVVGMLAAQRCRDGADKPLVTAHEQFAQGPEMGRRLGGGHRVDAKSAS